VERRGRERERERERDSVCVWVGNVHMGMSETEWVMWNDTIQYNDGKYDEEMEDASMVTNGTKQDKERYKVPQNWASIGWLLWLGE
jgi:hypothetical protein